MKPKHQMIVIHSRMSLLVEVPYLTMAEVRMQGLWISLQRCRVARFYLICMCTVSKTYGTVSPKGRGNAVTQQEAAVTGRRQQRRGGVRP